MTGWLIVTGDLVPHGGMDRANLELARYLAADHPVHLVTHRAAADIANLPNVTVHRIRRPGGRHLFGQPLLSRAGRKWAARFAPEGYRVVVNGGNCPWPDANWVHCVHAAYPAPAAGSAIRRVKQRLTHRFDRWCERRALRSARIAICNSRRTARDVVELLGVDPARTRVVYFGCDGERLTPISSEARYEARRRMGWEDRPWVGFVGQLGNRVKGFDTLFAAWVELCRDRTWDANLAVIGEGPNRSTWESAAAAGGFADRIRFLGFRSDVPDVLSGCDALVAPSRYDAYGLAVHEAICRGLPVIVSSAAGVSERYPITLGDLVLADAESVPELVSRLRHWRANTESLAARVGPLAAELRARSWADMARDIRNAILAT